MFRKTNSARKFHSLAEFSFVELFVKARCIIEAKLDAHSILSLSFRQDPFGRLSESINVDENFHFYYDILKEMAANKI